MKWLGITEHLTMIILDEQFASVLFIVQQMSPVVMYITRKKYSQLTDKKLHISITKIKIQWSTSKNQMGFQPYSPILNFPTTMN